MASIATIKAACGERHGAIEEMPDPLRRTTAVRVCAPT